MAVLRIDEVWTDAMEGTTTRTFKFRVLCETNRGREWWYFGTTTAEKPPPTEPHRSAPVTSRGLLNFPADLSFMTAEEWDIIWRLMIQLGLRKENV